MKVVRNNLSTKSTRYISFTAILLVVWGQEVTTLLLEKPSKPPGLQNHFVLKASEIIIRNMSPRLDIPTEFKPHRRSLQTGNFYPLKIGFDVHKLRDMRTRLPNGNN